METTSSCHRCQGWHLRLDTFKNFHNHPGKISDREKMLQGEWPGNGCEYCRDIEQAGGLSERLDYINKSQVVPREIAAGDLKATHVTPRILEIYFTNVCNQSCVYCGPQFSSQIAAEIDKYGPLENIYELDGTYKPSENYGEYKKLFWEWMEENANQLYRFHILGGEPMHQPEFLETISFFEKNACPDLALYVFTNLNHPTHKLKEKLDRLQVLFEEKHLKSVSLICSQDCWGKEAEYARYGTDMKLWEENFNLLLEYPWLVVNVHSTLACVTLPTAWELAEKIQGWRKQKDIGHGWNIIAHPVFFAPDIFGKHMKEYFDKLIAHSADVGYLKGFRDKVISKNVDAAQLLRLRNYLDKLDHRRNLNWREIYPWMDDIMKGYIIHG